MQRFAFVLGRIGLHSLLAVAVVLLMVPFADGTEIRWTTTDGQEHRVIAVKKLVVDLGRNAAGGCDSDNVIGYAETELDSATCKLTVIKAASTTPEGNALISSIPTDDPEDEMRANIARSHQMRAAREATPDGGVPYLDLADPDGKPLLGGVERIIPPDTLESIEENGPTYLPGFWLNVGPRPTPTSTIPMPTPTPSVCDDLTAVHDGCSHAPAECGTCLTDQAATLGQCSFGGTSCYSDSYCEQFDQGWCVGGSLGSCTCTQGASAASDDPRSPRVSGSVPCPRYNSFGSQRVRLYSYYLLNSGKTTRKIAMWLRSASQFRGTRSNPTRLGDVGANWSARRLMRYGAGYYNYKMPPNHRGSFQFTYVTDNFDARGPDYIRRTAEAHAEAWEWPGYTIVLRASMVAASYGERVVLVPRCSAQGFYRGVSGVWPQNNRWRRSCSHPLDAIRTPEGFYILSRISDPECTKPPERQCSWVCRPRDCGKFGCPPNIHGYVPEICGVECR